MAINTALLVAAPMLQDYFVDKDTGLPLAGGLVSFYQDNSRTTFKNVYYQTGVPGNYTYIPLPNPMTLTAVGTIADAMGNDVIPFFYPYSETDNVTPQSYYITVDSFQGERQFTRENFPFLPNRASTSNIPTLKNYIVNNVFWRNIQGAILTNITFTTISPSNHDGFTNPDIYFFKNITGAVDILDFFKFPQGDPANNSLPGAITPEFYLNLKCTTATVGETSKYISYPISLHVKTLENARATFTIWARTEGSSGANEISIELYQFLGTGVANSPVITLQTITLNQNWTRYTIPFIFPSSSGLTLSNAGDDAFYIFIQHPLDTEFNISHALPSLYLGNILPSEQFTTYDEVDSIVNTPRTGDIRTSLNAFYPFGWLPLNDGTIGAANSNSTTRDNIDTWQLYNLIWSYFNAPANQFFAPMYTAGGMPIAYGSSSYADFSSGNSITLTRTLGRVIAAAIPTLPTDTWMLQGAPPTSLLTISNTLPYNLGVPVGISSTGTLPSPLVTNIFYYMIPFNSTTFSLATTFENAINNIPILLTTSGTGTFSIILNTNAGSYTGNQNHSLTIPELAAHDHEPGSSLVNVALEPIQQGGGGASFSTLTFQPGSGMDFPVFVNTQGNGQPFSLYQPTAWYNMFIKL